VHVVVSLDNLILIFVPELALARVGNNRGSFTGEEHFALVELKAFFALTGLKINFNPCVQVKSEETSPELEEEDTSVPPSGENSAVGSLVAVEKVSCGPCWQENELNHER